MHTRKHNKTLLGCHNVVSCAEPPEPVPTSRHKIGALNISSGLFILNAFLGLPRRNFKVSKAKMSCTAGWSAVGVDSVLTAAMRNAEKSVNMSMTWIARKCPWVTPTSRQQPMFDTLSNE